MYVNLGLIRPLTFTLFFIPLLTCSLNSLDLTIFLNLDLTDSDIGFPLLLCRRRGQIEVTVERRFLFWSCRRVRDVLSDGITV